MNKEQLKAKKDSWDAMMQKRQDDYKYIKSLYDQLSYRDKLLFLLVVDFLANNPDTERVSE